jgi:polar amino acid transport system permease protein
MDMALLNILKGIPWTLALTVCAFVVGSILGFPLCAMRISSNRLIRTTATWIIVFCRSIPPIVWLFFVFFGVGSQLFSIGPFVASVIGRGIVTGSNMAEIYRGALTAIHPGQYEAARVLNLTRFQQFRDVVFPQLIRIALPTAATYLIGLLKDSAVASTIGVGEIAFESHRVSQATFQGLSVYSVAAVLYIALSIPVAWVSRWSDAHLRSRVSR